MCNLICIPQSFFGFKCSKESLACKNEHIQDLAATLNDIQSDTYLTLCRINNRPSIFQIALRAFQTIISQSEFSTWNRERNLTKKVITRPKPSIFEIKITKFFDTFNNKFAFKSNKTLAYFYTSLNNNDKTRFIRFCTNRYFRTDLIRRGFKVSDDKCPCCSKLGITGAIDTMQHYIQKHYNKKFKKIRSKVTNLTDQNLIDIFRSLDQDDHPVDLQFIPKQHNPP